MAKAYDISPLNQQQSVAILSHNTACSYYLTLDPSLQDAAYECDENPLSRAVATKAVLRGLNLSYPGFGSGPIELLVPDKERHRHADLFTTRSCSTTLPPGSFRKLGEKFFISCPELAYVQMSQYLTMPQLVVLGSNLCSKYYLDPNTKEIMHRKPLTTRERIARYLDTGEKIYGACKAKKALVYVEDRSASPMETKTHVLVCLPLHKGGHGFAKPVFNYEVNPGRYAHLAEQGHFEIDLCWVDEKVGIEYFGEKEHPDPIRDRRRLDALGALGWKIVVVDKRRLANPDSFEIAMKQVARHLGRRIRKPDGWAEKNLALRREIGIA